MIPHYTFRDYDECMLFPPFIFKESLLHFENSTETKDKINLFLHSANEITKRKEKLNHLVSKVPSVIKIIKDNNSSYSGIKTYNVCDPR